MLSCSLINFEVKRYHQKQPRFNDVYLKNNSPRIKVGACLKNLDDYKSIGTH